MPLMNSPFTPGKCLETVEAMEEGAQHDIAWAEYCYFSGQPEKAIERARPYLESDDIGARLSACLICSYAHLHFSQDGNALSNLAQIEHALHDIGDDSPQAQAVAAFLGSTSPAAAPRYARHGEGAVASAPGPAGFRSVHPGTLPVPEGGIRTQRGYCAGRPDDGWEPLPHSRHIPAPGRGDGLHEPEGRRTGTQASHECLVLCAAGRPD